MTNIITASQSRYSIENEVLCREGQPMEDMFYFGLANTLQFDANDRRILPAHFGYETPQGILDYLDEFKGRILPSLEEGIVQSHMVRLAGIRAQTVDLLKKSFDIQSGSMEDFTAQFLEKLGEERPEGKIGIVPFDILTGTLIGYE